MEKGGKGRDDTISLCMPPTAGIEGELLGWMARDIEGLARWSFTFERT